MPIDFLGFLSITHAPHIHAKGQKATAQLLNKLPCTPNENVLEIGFGTGTTLSILSSIYSKTRFHGVDISPKMYQKAHERIHFCGLSKHISLSLIDQTQKLPYETDSMDRVYIESVLAIQEGIQLEILLKEIKRVLKPKGQLLLNETIWLNSTSKKDINHINTSCKRQFGIIQANDLYPYLRDWEQLLSSLKFNILSIHPLDEIESFPLPFLLKSTLFSTIGKLRLLTNPSLKRQQRAFEADMKTILNSDTPLMKGYFFDLINEKS